MGGSSRTKWNDSQSCIHEVVEIRNHSRPGGTRNINDVNSITFVIHTFFSLTSAANAIIKKSSECENLSDT